LLRSCLRNHATLGALGATVVDPPHDDAGFLTAILADPQGNEFCVIKPPEGSYDEQRVVAEETGFHRG